jgi:hypothetical protein
MPKAATTTKTAAKPVKRGKKDENKPKRCVSSSFSCPVLGDSQR